MDGLALKNLAHSLAIVAHDGQSRKGTGEPYIRHVERVADRVQGWEAKTVAYLHDLIEDTKVSDATLYAMGFPFRIVNAVLLLTRDESETYREFIERTATSGDEIALRVKIADVQDNLRDIDDIPGGGKSLRRRYTAALARLVEVADPVPEDR